MSKTFQFSTDALDGNDDIEAEYEIDPSILNQRYTGFKKQYEEEEEEEEEEDDIQEDEEDSESDGNGYDYDADQKVKETLYAEDEDEDMEDDGDDDQEEETYPVNKDDYTTIILKFIFRLIFQVKKNWFKVSLYFGLFLINLLVISYFASSASSYSGNDEVISNIKSFGDISKSIQHLQWQINDINTKNKNKFHEFRHYLDTKIDEFNHKFLTIDDELKFIKKDNNEIISKLESIKFDEIVGQIKDERVPIIIDENNHVKIIPEFADFLQRRIETILNNQVINDREFRLNYEKFIENYVEEIVQNKVGFLNKGEILSLIQLQFQENKKKLINEIKRLNEVNKQPLKQNIPNNLINQEYSSPDKIGKINYGQAISGARVINYLTSPTFKPKTKGGSIISRLFNKRQSLEETQNSSDELEQVYSQQTQSPFIVLTSNDGYWRSSQTQDTQLSIKFLEPIYLTDFQYLHERVINGAILTSAPKHLSLFVQSDDNESLRKELDGDISIIKNHIKVSDFTYDMNGSIEQKFPLPSWLKLHLIKSVIVVSNDNYGNEFFTSFYKFKVNGLTRFDLYSIKKIMNDDKIDDAIKRRLNAMN